MLFVEEALIVLLADVYNGYAKEYDGMWGVLSGFFNIVAIIYIIVQAVSKPKPVLCPRCGTFVPVGYTFCPVCALPVMGRIMPTPEEAAAYRKKRTVFLVLFIVLYVLIIIASIIVMFHYMTEIMGLAYDYSGFY